MKVQPKRAKPLSSEPMPDFERPPVVEVALSIQFKELSKFQTPYAGFLWEEFRADYPQLDEKPPLPHLVETFPEPSQPQFTAFLGELPPPRRLVFMTSRGGNLVQIQPDRFVHNWRKMSEEDDYPRYDKVRDLSLKQWAKFTAFAGRHDLGEVEPDQYEMTYVNHFPQGEAWNTLADVPRLIRDLAWEPEGRFLPVPEGIVFRRSFILAREWGRLHSTLRRGQRKTDGRDVLVLELTARGYPLSADPREGKAMLDWFDLAHESIVRGFADLTTSEAQQTFWRRTQ
jgi:uncharacterized protein (TIGR04255 family)